MRRAAAGALAGGALAVALLLAAGLAIALIAPDASFLGASGAGASFVKGWLRASVALTGARFDGRTLAPLALVAVPLAAAAAGGRLAARLGGPRAGAAVALPFAAGLLALALAARGGYRDPFAAAFDLPARARADAGLLSTAVLGLVWGALGGALGTRRYANAGDARGALGTRRDANAGDSRAALGTRPDANANANTSPRSPRLQTAAAAARAVLLPLALTIAMLGAAGAVYWEVSTLRGDQLALVPPRAEATALVENALLAGEHAVDLIGLGARARFASLPLPVSHAAAVALSRRGSRRALSLDLGDYHRLLPGWAYGLLIIVCTALPLAGLAYSGARLVAALEPRSDGAAVAVGALTGPVWALAVLALHELSFYRGALDGGGLALRVLAAGSVVGAAAGAFAYRDTRGRMRA